MKEATALQAIGALLLVGGLIFTAAALAAGDDVDTLRIPAGTGWYFVIGFDASAGSRFAGRYSETTGRALDFYVFDDPQYAAYSRSGFPRAGALFQAHGEAGRFAVTASSPGKYYVVVDHGSGFEGQPQDVRIVWREDGLDPALWPLGAAAFLAGSVLLAAGHRKEKREKVARMAAAPRWPTDVIYFEPPRSPGP